MTYKLLRVAFISAKIYVNYNVNTLHYIQNKGKWMENEKKVCPIKIKKLCGTYALIPSHPTKPKFTKSKMSIRVNRKKLNKFTEPLHGVFDISMWILIPLCLQKEEKKSSTIYRLLPAMDFLCKYYSTRKGIKIIIIISLNLLNVYRLS